MDTSSKQGHRLICLTGPFVYGAVAINLFLLGLLLPSIGLPALSPISSMLVAIPVSIPAVWLTVRWVQKLLEEAEG